jgi:hypothetical protein
MIDTDKYEGLTIDDWYKMNHHDWKDVVNEHNDLLAEVIRLREMYDNKLEELKSLRELNSLLCGKYEILEQLEGFDEILGLIG